VKGNDRPPELGLNLDLDSPSKPARKQETGAQLPNAPVDLSLDDYLPPPTREAPRPVEEVPPPPPIDDSLDEHSIPKTDDVPPPPPAHDDENSPSVRVVASPPTTSTPTAVWRPALSFKSNPNLNRPTSRSSPPVNVNPPAPLSPRSPTSTLSPLACSCTTLRPSKDWTERASSNRPKAIRPLGTPMMNASARFATFSSARLGTDKTPPLSMGSPRTPDVQDKRTQVAMEILTSEQAYVKSLGECVTTYLSVLKRSRADIITKEEYGTLFSNFEDVYRHNRRFLHQLEEQMKDWTCDTLIGLTFQGFYEGYTTQIYSQYINNFEDAMALYDKLMEQNASFKSFVQSARKVSDIDLQTYLRLPLKRLNTFIDLMTKLSQITPTFHPDAGHLDKALEDAKASMYEIDALKRKSDGQRRVKALAEKLIALPPGMNLVENTRYIIQDGMCTDHGVLKKKPLYLVLLSDLVITATPVKDKLKVKDLASLFDVPIPQPTKVTKAQLNGFILQISGNTHTLVPEDCDSSSWISSFQEAKEGKR